jgi:hypothetical protein
MISIIFLLDLGGAVGSAGFAAGLMFCAISFSFV